MTREAEGPTGVTAPAAQGAADTALGQTTTPQLREILGPREQTDRAMLEEEDALRVVRQRFAQTEDPEVQEELAAEALERVERQLELTRERRRQLDSVEAKLWGRRNRVEGLLIHTRGSAWWHARRERRGPGQALAQRTIGRTPRSSAGSRSSDEVGLVDHACGLAAANADEDALVQPVESRSGGFDLG
jgi:hypothetical protein